MATLTISTTAAQDARLVTAFGAKLELHRNATVAEIKADILRYLRTVVEDQERIAAIEAQKTAAPAFEPT